MLTLVEIGTVFAVVGSLVFYFLLLFLSNREKVATNRDLHRLVTEQSAQLQAMEVRLRYVEATLYDRNGPATKPPAETPGPVERPRLLPNDRALTDQELGPEN